MFKKRKEAKAKELDNERLQSEAQLEAALEAAAKIEDPAEKILELSQLRKSALDGVSYEEYKGRRKAVKAGAGANLGTIAGTVGAGIALAPVTGGVSIIAGLATALVGGAYIDDKRKGSVQKKYEDAAQNHFKKIENLSARAEELIDATIEENVSAISKSPLYQDVLAIDGLAEKFSVAAAKQLEDAEKAVKAAEAKAAKEPEAAAPEKQKPDYKRLSGFGNG